MSSSRQILTLYHALLILIFASLRSTNVLCLWGWWLRMLLFIVKFSLVSFFWVVLHLNNYIGWYVFLFIVSAYSIVVYVLLWYANSHAHAHLGSDRSPLNLDRSIEHDRHPLAIMAADAVAASGVPPWNWRDTSVNGNVLVMLDIQIFLYKLL